MQAEAGTDMDATAAAERRKDLEWLEIVTDGDVTTATVRLSAKHVTPYRRLYGGIGSALVSAMIEAASGRPLLWATTQFVGQSFLGDELVMRADVLARGSRASQVRITATLEDATVLVGTGAAGFADPDAPSGTMLAMPQVPPPSECPVVPLRLNVDEPGFFALVEQRAVPDPDRGDGARRWWMRMRERPITRPAFLDLAGDCVAPMVTRALGGLAPGTSLDNTIRVAAPSSGEWVLVDGEPEFARGGFGHGTVRLWDEAGALVGVASQTASLWRHHAVGRPRPR